MRPVNIVPIRQAIIFSILGIIGFLIILAVAAYFIGFDSILKQLALIHPSFLLVLLLLSLINYLLRATRWYICSQFVGLETKFWENCVYYFAGFALTITPGKVGEMLRLYLLKQRYAISYDKSFPLFFMDKLTDLYAMLILCLLTVYAFDSYRFMTLGIAAVAIVLTVLALKPNWLLLVLESITKFLPVLTKPFATLIKSLHNHADLMYSPQYFWSLVISLVGWLSECIAFYWLLHYLDFPISVMQATFIFAFATLVGAISFIPGGLGAAETIIVGLLIMLRCPSSVAVVSTFVIRLTTFWWAILIGFTLLPMALHLIRYKKIVPAVNS